MTHPVISSHLRLVQRTRQTDRESLYSRYFLYSTAFALFLFWGAIAWRVLGW